jgi:hypothetical protein
MLAHYSRVVERHNEAHAILPSSASDGAATGGAIDGVASSRGRALPADADRPDGAPPAPADAAAVGGGEAAAVGDEGRVADSESTQTERDEVNDAEGEEAEGPVDNADADGSQQVWVFLSLSTLLSSVLPLIVDAHICWRGLQLGIVIVNDTGHRKTTCPEESFSLSLKKNPFCEFTDTILGFRSVVEGEKVGMRMLPGFLRGSEQ